VNFTVLPLKDDSCFLESRQDSLYTLTTVVYNFVHKTDATEEMVERIIQDTVNIYPEIHIIVGVPHTVSVRVRRTFKLTALYYKTRSVKHIFASHPLY